MVVKAQGATQINTEEDSNASDWLEPELPLLNLGQMVKNSNILPQCIRAYCNNIAGYGIGVKYIEDDQKEQAGGYCKFTDDRAGHKTDF